jgi:hypothetical protein
LWRCYRRKPPNHLPSDGISHCNGPKGKIMPGVINAEIVVDTQSILSEYPDPSQDPDEPTPVTNDFCYMIAQSIHVIGGQATAHLSINQGASHVIQVRSLSLSGNAGQSAVVYDIEKAAGKTVTGRLLAREADVEMPLPSLDDGRNTDPPSFSTVTANDYFLQTEVTSRGSESLQVRFYITTNDDQAGTLKIVGYFLWCPSVTFARPEAD